LAVALFVFILAAKGHGALAQELEQASSPRPYVRLPYEGNLETLLRMKLAQARGHGEFQRWLQDLAKDTSRLRPENKQLQEEFKEHLANPLVRKQIEELSNDPARSNLDPARLAEVTKKLGQLMQPPAKKEADLSGEKKQFPSRSSGPSPLFNPPAPSPPPPPPEEREERFGDWLRERLQDLEDSPIGETLQDSPAFQQALLDMQESLQRGESQVPGLGSLDVAELASRLHFPDWDLSGLGGALPKLDDLPLPALPRLNLGGLGQWQLPAPGRGTSGSTALAGQILLVVVLLAAGGILLRQVLARMRLKRASRAGAGWRLGPWPIHPSRIANRADLVRAFAYLSLLRFGPGAITWNHLAVADRLAAKAPGGGRRQNAAEELAALYEQARYAPEDEPLSAEALAAARRDLCLLAGVAHE
jgi:hypothetical protein